MLRRDGTRDRARPGTQVDDQRPVRNCEAFQHPADHHLGLRPRDEHARADGQLPVPECRRTREVLQRLAGRAALHQLGVRRLLLGGDVQQREPAPGGAAHMREQLGRVVPG
jgi:hypothetical protein